MGCPVCELPYIMPYEELVCWAIRYDFGKFGKKMEDYRAGMQAKITNEAFSSGKVDIPIEKYILKFEESEKKEKDTQITNMAIVGGLFPGVIPPEVFEKELNNNGNSSDTDSTSEA